jgi:hypothetical protein
MTGTQTQVSDFICEVKQNRNFGVNAVECCRNAENPDVIERLYVQYAHAKLKEVIEVENASQEMIP